MYKFKYIVVVGCSFSSNDYPAGPQLGETYGDVVAKYFDAECINFAYSGCGVYAIHRIIFNWCSKNKEKMKDTLFILGIPPFQRIEMWSNLYNKWFKVPPNRWESDYLGRDETKKIRERDILINTWPVKERKNWFRNFYNEREQFTFSTNLIVGLQYFFKSNNLSNIFFESIWPVTKDYDIKSKFTDGTLGRDIGVTLDFDVEHYENLVLRENWYVYPKLYTMRGWIINDKSLWVSDDDPHPNKKAHELWGNFLIKFLISNRENRDYI